MQSLGSLHTTPTEAGSNSFTISESCVRSDIENIIKKMYTPRGNSSLSRGCYHQVSLLEAGGKYVPDQSNASTTFSESSDHLDRRFGFYFHSRTGNEVGLQQLVVDASASDSVSVPEVRVKLKKHRVVCECCRKNISNRVRGRSNCCRVCDDKAKCEDNPEVHSKPGYTEVKMLHENLKMKKLSMEKGQGDVTDHRVGSDSPQWHEKDVSQKPSIATFQGRNITLIPYQNNYNNDGSNNCTKIVKPIGVISCENLQVVPTFDEDVFQESKSQNLVEKLSNQKLQLERPSSTVFRRAIGKFSIWSLLFHKTKVQKHKHCTGFTKTNSSNLVAVVSSARFQNGQGDHIMPDPIQANRVNLDYFGQSQHTIPGARKSCDCIVERVVETQQIHHNRVRSKRSKGKTNRGLGLPETNFKSPEGERREIALDASKSSAHILKVGDFEVNEKKSVTQVSQPSNKPSCLCVNKVDSDIENSNTKICQTDELSHPLILPPEVHEDDNSWATRLWAQAFQSCAMGGDFITAFILQTFKFLLHNLIQPLFCGTVQVWSDFFFKPLLATLFSSVLQPVMHFLQDVTRSLRDVCLPIAECCGHFWNQIFIPCGSWRLVEIHRTYIRCSDCKNNT